MAHNNPPSLTKTFLCRENQGTYLLGIATKEREGDAMTHNRLDPREPSSTELQTEVRAIEQLRYAAFELWLSRQLVELEARWQHFKVPDRGSDSRFQLPR
jgi:hypothetical protein